MAGETDKYMDIVDIVDTCRVPTGLHERTIVRTKYLLWSHIGLHKIRHVKLGGLCLHRDDNNSHRVHTYVRL